MHTTSVSLLHRLRQPAESEAWRRFVQLYTPLLFTWVRRLGLNENDAADIVQDIFVVLLRKLPEFRYDQKQSFRAWLHTILLNRWRSLRRRRQPMPVNPQTAMLFELEGPSGEPALDEAEYKQKLVQRALQIIHDDFESITWEAWSQYVESGRPAAEVARSLGVSAQAVYMAKARILRRLREELDGLLD
jgi:RNA polymerase sigma-70 factor, ECF subfamily